MVTVIKRCARLMALMAFFTIFFLSLDPADIFNTWKGSIAIVKGFCAAALVWLVAFVLFDIFFKGIVEDISLHDIDELEEGLLQRVREAHAANADGRDQPVCGKPAGVRSVSPGGRHTKHP